MKHTFIKIGKCLLCLALALIVAGCGNSSDNPDGITITDPDEIVPAKSELVEGLEKNGYTITEYTDVEGSDLTIDRVVAEKENKYIDITYGLSDEDAGKVFNAYCELYSDDYYILAMNGNYVYCVSDKDTFSKAGFTTTANIGVQYIHN